VGGPANAHKTTAAINLPRALRIHQVFPAENISLQLGNLKKPIKINIWNGLLSGTCLIPCNCPAPDGFSRVGIFHTR
jgi:hypothetical protein